jgi:hypothetical protein
MPLYYSQVSQEHLYKLDFYCDFDILRKEVARLIEIVGFDRATNQISLTHSPNCAEDLHFFEATGSLYNHQVQNKERQFPIFNSKWQNSYLHWIYQNLPFRVGRMRVMQISPKCCLSLHVDSGPRYHFAIQTNSEAFIVFPKHQKIYHIPADGNLYYMDAQKPHTALNANFSESRIHLVFSNYDLC